MMVMKFDVSGLSYCEIMDLLGRLPMAGAEFAKTGGTVILNLPAVPV